MAVNDKIRTPDYNVVQSALAGVMGTGSGNSGWGQIMKSSQVSTSSKVSINEWDNLRYDIISAYTHINGSAPTTARALEGNTVKYSSAFTPDTGTLDKPVTQYSTYVTNIVANKFAVGAGQYSTTAATSSATTWPSVLYGTNWSSKIQCTITVEWTSAAAARYFFNSGGQIRILSSRSGGAATAQNNSWTSILSTAGTQEFGGNNPGTGTTPADAQNWYRLTNTYTTWYTVTGSSPYGGNSYKISAKCPVVNNSSGTASSAQFLLEFIDNYTDPGIAPMPSGNPNTSTPAMFPPDDVVNGTFTVSVSSKYASGILSPAAQGNFTVSTPTITVGAVAP